METFPHLPELFRHDYDLGEGRRVWYVKHGESFMRWIDILRIAVRVLVMNRLRTLLTMLGIATAISLIVVLTGLGYGFEDITIGSIVRSKSLLSADIMAAPNSDTILTSETISAIAKMPEVADLSPVVQLNDAQVEFGGKLVSNALEAVDTRFFSIEGISPNSGRLFNDAANEIVLSPQMLKLLGAKESDILGQLVSVRMTNPKAENSLITLEHELTVVGTTREGDTSAMFIPYSLVKAIPGLPITSVKVLAKNRDSVARLQDTIKQKGYSIETLLDTLDAARRVFMIATITLLVIALIALVVAAIGMFNTLTITLLERTREIGIMKAVGVTNGVVKRLFLTEAMLLGFGGGVLGVLIGLAVDQVANFILNVLASRFGGPPVEIFRYPPGFLITIILFPVTLGAITGLYPALRAAKYNPIKALKYE